MQLDAVLHQIDAGDMALPEFQRGYVWNRDQVRGLMSSLYRKYPVGSLLVWLTPTQGAAIRGDGAKPAIGSVRMLLDGQQRITTLYGIVRGKAPAFFQGDERAFTGLYFHLDDEVFEFYAPLKMANDPLWIDVTQLMKENVAPAIQRIVATESLAPRVQEYINRLNSITQIRSIDLHVEEVTGKDKSLDVVVDIFNRVNSGGTKLSKGDLALAKVCAEWPEARQRLRLLLEGWRAVGFDFQLEWLLRAVTTIVTGQAFFAGLKDVGPDEFQAGLGKAEQAINYLINLLSARLGIDHDRVLGGRYAFPVMARYVAEAGGKMGTAEQQSRLLYWYVHSFLWGRFAGSTESLLNTDLRALEHGGVDELIRVLRQSRGDLQIRPDDFSGSTLGARFYPLLYLLTRTGHARDLAGGGLELSAHMLGKLAGLQVHHIFPKAVLYSAGYNRGEVNAIANFCFLSQDANLEILARPPADYFYEVEQRFPGALASQWIPLDESLRSLDRYRDFLAARRELLAAAANSFLDGLLADPAPAVTNLSPSSVSVVLEDEESQPFAATVRSLVEEHGLAAPARLDIVEDPVTGDELGIADYAWHDGLQGGHDEPVVVLLDPAVHEPEKVRAAGYRVFLSIEALEQFVEKRAADLVGAAPGA